MATASATLTIRIVVPQEFRWREPLPPFEFVVGERKAWDINEHFRNAFAPAERPEFGLVSTAPELVGAFDVLGDALRYDGTPLTLPEGYTGWVSLVAGRRDNPAGSRAIDGAGREWLLIGRQLDGDGAPGAVLVDEGGPFGHEFLRVPPGGAPWQAWYIEADGALVYSLVGDENLEWYVHDGATKQPAPAPQP